MVDPLDNLTSSEQLRSLLLREEQERLDRLEIRFGDDDALKRSLVPVIADILRDAGVKDHRRLADALAPIVLQSIKTEIHNSRDMMVDALYPITGRLVAAAVRNAFKDLVDQLNTKLDSTLSVDRWRARLKAKLSGRSEAEILLSEGAAFEIVDLLLIDRQSGLLIAQAVADADQDGASSHLLSSILTAIMAFVRDAMSESSEQDLRTLHVGDMRLHLQVSPSAILAIKTKGPPPAGFETALSESFYAFLSRWGDTLSEPDEIESHQKQGLTEDLEERFRGLLQAKQSNFRKPSKKGAILLGALAAIALLWISWTSYHNWSSSRIETVAQSMIDQDSSLRGFPIEARYAGSNDTLTISGLFPNQDAIEALRAQLQERLPNVLLSMNVGKLPDRASDLAEFPTQSDLIEALARSDSRLRADLTQEVTETRGVLRKETKDALAESTSALSKTLALIEQRLPTIEEVERSAFNSWLVQQLIRFDDDSELSNEADAQVVLKEVAERLSRLPDHFGLRVIGYSDDLGEERVSFRVSEARASLVAKKLNELGIPVGRLQIVGRGSEKRINDVDGIGSINRRVEFEITYLVENETADGAGHGNQ